MMTGYLACMLFAAASLASFGTYLDQPPPRAAPRVFAHGVVSTDHLEHSAPAFSPDGDEIFWSVWRRPKVEGEPQVIMTMRREGGAWSAPAVASFSGTYVDGGPVFSSDGRRVYFYSLRPVAGETGRDLWFVERREGGWSEPQCVGLVARFPKLRFAVQPSVGGNGTLCFVGHTDGPLNGYGIYCSRFVNGQHTRPELLPRSINLPPFLNWTPFIAPDESYLLFSSNRRAPESDAGDLYISRRQTDGTWADPVSLGEPINSGGQERFPAVSPDGRHFFFTRPTPGHDQDIYWADANAIVPLRSTPNAPPATVDVLGQPPPR